MSTNTEDMLSSLGANTPTPAAVPMGEESKSSLPALSNIEQRALDLLGIGIIPEKVAAALGVTASYVSQLLANESFAGRVADVKYKNLQQHSARDSKYDSVEDSLIAKLENAVPLMIRPETILKAIQVINGAKRRGQAAPDAITSKANIVTLVMPQQIVQQFATNVNNQVIKAGEQELQTMASGNLLDQVESVTNQITQTKSQVSPNPAVPKDESNVSESET